MDLNVCSLSVKFQSPSHRPKMRCRKSMSPATSTIALGGKADIHPPKSSAGLKKLQGVRPISLPASDPTLTLALFYSSPSAYKSDLRPEPNVHKRDTHNQVSGLRWHFAIIFIIPDRQPLVMVKETILKMCNVGHHPRHWVRLEKRSNKMFACSWCNLKSKTSFVNSSKGKIPKL